LRESRKYLFLLNVREKKNTGFPIKDFGNDSYFGSSIKDFEDDSGRTFDDDSGDASSSPSGSISVFCYRMVSLRSFP
jgi:hypothetical protein